MEFVYAKALYPEKRGFTLERHEKNGEYIFVHFLSPVLLEKDGRMIEVSAGGCIVWDKNSYRNFFSPDCDLLHNWFHATGDVPEVLSRYGIKFGEIYYPAPDDFITSYIQKIEIELLQNSAFCREICAHRAEELFAMIARNTQQTESTPAVDRATHRLFVDARQKIHQRYAKDWTVDDMAALTGFSPSRFFALYHLIFGISPKRDLTLVRLEHAKTLLQNSEYTVQRVAEEVGFPCESHFIRSFRREYGSPPRRFSRNIGIE